MTVRTPHYFLEAFTWGDYYSSSVDRRRFTIIDNQLAFLSDMIGGGRIYGWQLSEDTSSSLSISVSAGMGMIGRRIISTFGSFNFTTDYNTTKYVYALAKTGEMGGVSGFSDVINIIASDDTIPSMPANLQEIVNLRSYNQLAFQWTVNSEVDFSHYVVERSEDEVYGIFVEIGQTTSTSYIDSDDLNQNTVYIYRVIAIDFSGHRSDPAEILLMTDLDMRIPLSPTFVQLVPGDGIIQVIWNRSASDNVDRYRIVTQLLNNFRLPVGEADSFYISAYADSEFGSSFTIVRDLDNTSNYQITVYSVTINNVESEGIAEKATPYGVSGAGEVSCVTITFSESQFTNINMEMNVLWNYYHETYDDPYFGNTIPEKFSITLIENAVRTSEPIVVLPSATSIVCPDFNDPGYNCDDTVGLCYDYNIKFVPFRDNDNNIKYESMKNYTPYLVIVRTIDADDNVSNGVIVRINRTPSYALISPVSNLAISREADNSILISWVNPMYQIFDYNSITVDIIDMAGGLDVKYADNEKINRSTSFIISNDYFDINKRYEVTVYSIDVFARSVSNELIKTFTTDDMDRPDSPSNINISNGDGQVDILWNISINSEIASYNIYRTGFSALLRYSNFLLITTLASNQGSFIDYSVQNGTTYIYIVTSVDIYGVESIDMTSSNIVSDITLIGKPRKSSLLSPPVDLIITDIGSFDAKLEWTILPGSFDGYEIYRSIGDVFSFSLVNYVANNVNSYIDNDILLKDNEIYYYMIRKFRNEASFLITESIVAPEDSIILGSVITSADGSMQINNTLAMELLNYEEPIRNKTDEKIDIHIHNWTAKIDKRIELRTTVVITDWTTSDFRTYTTEKDIEGATNYIVKISGEVDPQYFTDDNDVVDVVSLQQARDGVSPVLYDVNGTDGVITFVESLYNLCTNTDSEGNPQCPVTPYVTGVNSVPPVISLELVGISETENTLLPSKLESLSATQVTSGIINPVQLPNVRHEGRIQEDLVPLKLPMQTSDDIVYSLANIYSDDDRNNMGDAVTFYHIIYLEEENKLLAATSSGVWYSEDYGNSWPEDQKTTFPCSVHNIYRSVSGNYYAITNYNIYLSEGNFIVWVKMSGLQHVKIIRDITEDYRGDLYISTDLGVFRLNKDKPYIEDTWEQLTILGVRSSDAYALLFDSNYTADPSASLPGRLLVSNEIGILQSTNGGQSWIYLTSLSDPVKIYKFIRSQNSIFALSNKAIYRQNYNESTLQWGNFDKIADINVNISRLMQIYNNVIYISTDEGPQASVTTDIYSDTDITFTSIWSIINVKNNTIIVTSLNLITDDLFIGTDKKLFILHSDNNISLMYEQFNSVVPSIYVNKSLQKLGFYYNNKGAYQNISFDEQLSYGDIVEVANKYDIYTTMYGGWVEQKYDAKIEVILNDAIYGQSVSIDIDNAEFLNFVFPSYNEINSYKENADIYKAQVETNINTLTGRESLDTDTLRELITDTYNNLEKFLSQLYESARVIYTGEVDSNGNPVTEPLILPKINVSIWQPPVLMSSGVYKYKVISNGNVFYSDNPVVNYGSINVVNGVVNFSLPFDKYDEIKVNIYDCTVKNVGELGHRLLEDNFELFNSGFPSLLSQVQQNNINKLGLFTESHWPGRDISLSPPWQSEFFIPRNDTWYDTLNSTINYNLQDYNNDISFSIIYPVAVCLTESKVFVGGRGGGLSITTDTLEMDNINIDFIDETIMAIREYNNIIYLLTNKRLYQSDDYGTIWNIIENKGLPNGLYSLGFISNNIIVGTSNGLYYKSFNAIDWSPSDIITTDSLIVKYVGVITDPDLLFAVVSIEIDGVVSQDIYRTSDGYHYTKLNVGGNFNIADMRKFGNTMYVATDKGLYADADINQSSFYGNNPRLIAISITDDTLVTNALSADDNKLVIGLDNGSYYIMENNIFTFNEYTPLECVHKIIISDDDIWLFGYNLLYISSLNYPVRLCSSVPV